MKRLLSFLRSWLRRDRTLEPPPRQEEGPPVPPISMSRIEGVARTSHARTERTVVIGVDFGTSSTKVIWQDLRDNHFEVFRWRPARSGSAAMLLPSTILLRGGSIHFGIPAQEVRDGDILLSSIKLCVLCRRKPSICRCGNAMARHGMVRLPGLGDAIPASSFACLFLAHVFREVESSLVDQFPSDDILLIWNVGCPMDHLDTLDRRDEWERMAGAAMELRRRVSNPVDSALVAEATSLVQSMVVADRGDRNYFVQPEGLAAVKAFLESPHADSKTYAIVDVGAGTTEVSFFFNGRVMAEPGQPYRPSYLADSTEAVGGGKIDIELAQTWACAVEDARRRKEAGQPRTPIVPSIEEICGQYRRTCCEVLRENKLSSPHDKRFDLFVIGGGGRLSILRAALQNHLLPGSFVRDHLLPLKPPRSLKNRMDLEKDYDFLANACGLASSLDWQYYPPREVPPMGSPPTRPRQDVEEYYPK